MGAALLIAGPRSGFARLAEPKRGLAVLEEKHVDGASIHWLHWSTNPRYHDQKYLDSAK
jgi:hypothetical protein